MLFYGTTEGISTNLRPYWLEASKGRADITQAQTDMLEIIPPGASKGKGVKLLLDHLGVTPKEVCIVIYFVLLLENKRITWVVQDLKCQPLS